MRLSLVADHAPFGEQTVLAGLKVYVALVELNGDDGTEAANSEGQISCGPFAVLIGHL